MTPRPRTREAARQVAGLRTRRPALSEQGWEPAEHLIKGMRRDVVLDCGWGRLVFGYTFRDQRDIVDALRAEGSGRRDICVYPRDPQVLVGLVPYELFIDPSYTYRLPIHRYRPSRERLRGILVRTINGIDDFAEVNRIYAANSMVTGDIDVMWANQRTRAFTYLVAEDTSTGQIVGTVTGVDHVLSFGDPDQGASLWCLAVDPQTGVRGVGEALTRTLAERYAARSRAYLDLSVLHTNTAAIALYTKLGFQRVPAVCVKRKNPINTHLFAPAPPELSQLNPYARLIADEALRRGVSVEVTDGLWGEMRLSHSGRTVLTRESLSELTTAVVMSRCDDKRVTRRILERAGIAVPRGRALGPKGIDADDLEFLEEVGEAVVKPARGEQGRGITVGVTDEAGLRKAVALALTFCPDVLIEELVAGEDLRVVVIDHRVVAAAVRVPATVVGTGRDPIRELIRMHSARRSRATGGESTIPLDETTETVVRDSGHELDDVLAPGVELRVRRTANLHTGGTIEDVTPRLHPDIEAAAVLASRAIGIPVTGLDFLVPDLDDPDHVCIEANERPGLANHEPRPTAERFLDLLFPETRRTR